MTAQLSPVPVQKFFDANGFPLFNGTLSTYQAGTTTPQATYIDSTQTTPNTNPIQLNYRGECNLWLDPTLSYKFVLKDVLGNTIWTVDNIAGGFGAAPLSISLIPNPTNTYTLGNSTHSWAQLYLGPNADPAYNAVSDTIGYIGRTAAEIAAGVTPVNYAYPPGSPFIDIRRYGADPTGVTDSTTAIQNAILVAGQIVSTGLQYSGGIVWIPPGTYKITNTLTMRPNVTIWGAGCGDTSTYGAFPRASILQPSAAFPANSDVIRADPHDYGTDVYCRGPCLCSFMIDLINATNVNITAIHINSVSDAPVFRDLRVWNVQPSHTGLKVGVSTNASALLSDGLVFQNLIVNYILAGGSTGDAVTLEDCNEVSFRDGKITGGGGGTSSSVGIHCKATNIGCSAITLDGVSIAGFNAGVETTATGGGLGTRWLRVVNCTFEQVKFPIFLTGIVSLQAQFCTILGNRFLWDTTPPAGATCVTLDFASNNLVIVDDFVQSPAIGVNCTGNSGGNTIWGLPSNVTDSGTGNTSFAHTTSVVSGKGQMQFTGIQTNENAFTLTASAGLTASGTCRYTQVGNNVTLQIPQLVAAASGTSISFSGIPAAIQPARTQRIAVMVANNSADTCGFIQIGTSGSATLSVLATGTISSTFANAGTQGIEANTVTYNLL